MRCRSLVLLLALVLLPLAAQELQELYTPEDDDVVETPERLAILAELAEDPLAINTADAAQLKRLFWLSASEIELLLRHRPFATKRELFAVGLDAEVIAQTLPYITLYMPQPVRGSSQIGSQYNAAWRTLPSSVKYTHKSQITWQNYAAGAVLQKDAGEADWADFLSAFAEYQSAGFFRQALVGDFRAAFGQGIVLAPALGFHKGAATTSAPLHNYQTIKPYTSSYEAGNLRGAALTLGSDALHFTAFGSAVDRTVSLDDSLRITSFDDTGQHLSGDEEQTREEVLGALCQFEHEHVALGAAAVYTGFEHPLADGSAQKYWCYAISAGVQQQNWQWVNEAALSDKSCAWLSGLRWGTPEYRHLLMARYYPAEFPTHLGNPFSTGSSFANEQGIYYGFRARLATGLLLRGYFDVWHFPQPRYFEKMPTSGSEEYISVQWQRGIHRVTATMRAVCKEKYISLDTAEIRDFQRLTLRCEYRQQPSDWLEYKTRLAFSSDYLPAEKQHESGILNYQQMKLKWGNWSCTARISASFGDVLLYVHEPDIIGSFSNQMFKGDVISGCILIDAQISKRGRLQAKYRDDVGKNNAAYAALFCRVNF